MALMNWNVEQYAVNVNFADEEHKNVFKKLNVLYALSTGGAEHDIIGTQLDDLIAYVAGHFAHEEKEMLLKNFQGYVAHKEDHDALISTCNDMQVKFHAGDMELSERVCHLIKFWFDNHIPAFDRFYSNALNS